MALVDAGLARSREERAEASGNEDSGEDVEAGSRGTALVVVAGSDRTRRRGLAVAHWNPPEPRPGHSRTGAGTGERSGR